MHALCLCGIPPLQPLKSFHIAKELIFRYSLSRYITILFFLNNVTEGGETAFPVADREELFVGKNYSTNLSRNCNRASLVVKPVKGSALLWYNNVLDEESGKMGEVDMLTLHGGCDVIEGEKWIANLWLNAPRGDQTVWLICKNCVTVTQMRLCDCVWTKHFEH